jgi:DNA-binding response OmpR family regulator
MENTDKKSRPTVLIVDDERLYCDLLGTILGRSGYEVITASGGREGIKLFRQWRPKFTLLDLRLPDIHGIEVLREIRKIDPQAPVMVLTNWGTDFVENQARQLGVRDFFSKKMTLDTIMSSMERALKQPTDAPAAQAPAAESTSASAGMLAQEASPPTQASTVRTPPRGGAAAPSERREGELILVVDDEPQVLDVLSQFLTQRGYRVRTASDGAEALSLVDRECPALIILDMYMPGMNGIGVLRQLHERKNTSGIILLTGSQDEKLLAESLNLGVVEIIGKPVNFDQLALAVRLGLVITNR